MFRIIPEKILLDKELPDKAKFIMSDILSWSVSSMQCFSSNTWFAERYGISNNSVSRIISLLVDKGYVDRSLIYKENTKQIVKRILIPTQQVMFSLEETKRIIADSLSEAALDSKESILSQQEKKIYKGVDIAALKKIWE